MNEFTFENSVDQANQILITKLSGFCSSLDAYGEWERAFTKAWQDHFGNRKIKVLSDQRGFKPTRPEVIERVTQLRRDVKAMIVASATVVDSAITRMQLKRLSAESGFGDIEEFFTDYQEALNWLKSR